MKIKKIINKIKVKKERYLWKFNLLRNIRVLYNKFKRKVRIEKKEKVLQFMKLGILYTYHC